jgi:hypothetical protein
MKDGRVTNRPEFMADTDFDILQRYQWHYAGVMQYYSLAQNKRWLTKLHWVMQSSALRTLANKYKSSVGKMWRKYRATVQTPQGPRRCLQVVINREGKKPLISRFGGLSWARDTETTLKDRVTIFGPTRTELSKRLLAENCEVCGNEEMPVEVHHVRKLANLTKKGRNELPLWKKIMISRRRKTLVVCLDCHHTIHHGKSGSPEGH